MTKNGQREKTFPRSNCDPMFKCTHKHVVHIVSDQTGEEVTCWVVPLELQHAPGTEEMKKQPATAQENMLKHSYSCRHFWKHQGLSKFTTDS